MLTNQESMISLEDIFQGKTFSWKTKNFLVCGCHAGKYFLVFGYYIRKPVVLKMLFFLTLFYYNSKDDIYIYLFKVFLCNNIENDI